MRLLPRSFTVTAAVLIASAVAVDVGNGAQPATASGAAHSPVEQVQTRLLAARVPDVGDKDVVDVTDSYVFTCGYASCTYYIGRRGTKAAADYIERRENITSTAATLIAGGACAATGAGAAVVTVCSGAATAAAAYVIDEVKAAGERGECLRLRYYHYPMLLPATPAADTSGYCMNG